MEINLPMSPPVNNNIQGNAYDKLDAVVFEKTRVANTLLDARRSIQEKMINKYRKDVERVHVHQKERLRREYRNIRKKKPDYVFDEPEVKERGPDVGRQRSLSDPSNCSFCRRYYAHHFNVKDKTKKKKEQDVKKDRKDEHFNMTLRLFFLNMMNHARERTHHHDDTQEHPNAAQRERIKVKPHSYDPRFPDEETETLAPRKRSQSLSTWGKVDEEDDCEELKDLGEYTEETDVFDCSLNASKFSLDSGIASSQPKSKLNHSLNLPSCTSIAEESRMDVKEDKELWKRSKRAFEKIFSGLL